MFKDRFDINERCKEFYRIKSKFPEKIPIICEIDPKENNIDRKALAGGNKYLVDIDFTVGQFMYVIRKRIKVPQEKAIFLMVGNNVIPPTGELISNIYFKYRDQNDKFLYILLSSESTFG